MTSSSGSIDKIINNGFNTKLLTLDFYANIFDGSFES